MTKSSATLSSSATFAGFATSSYTPWMERLSEWPKGTGVLPTLDPRDAPNVPPPDPDAWDGAHDQPLPEDDAIDAAFPMRSGRHDLYAEAMRFVGARRSKSGLVALVNWLLHRAAKQGA